MEEEIKEKQEEKPKENKKNALEELEEELEEIKEGVEETKEELEKEIEEEKETDAEIEKFKEENPKDTAEKTAEEKKAPKELPSEETIKEEIEDVQLEELKKKKPKKKKEEEEKETEEKEEKKEPTISTHIYALRTTANREDQVMDFVSSNAAKKKLDVFSVIRPHGMRGYIFLEAGSRGDAEQSAFNVPYARGLLPNEIDYSEIEHMLEQVKREINIQKNDICEIISGPFKREKAKITRIDKGKEEVVVELLESAVPIPITVKMDAIKVIRRDKKEEQA